MKNFLILALFAGIIACNPKPIAKINGDIQNKEADVIIISNQLLKSNDTLKIVDNTFSVTLKVEQPGIYDFQHGNYGFQMYLKPGTEMQIDLDIANLKEGDYSKIAIGGKGIDETKLMMKVSALNAGVMSGLRNMLALPSDSFETAINKYKQELTATIDSFKATGKESKHFLDRINTVKIAQTITRADLLSSLEAAGYERNDFTEKPAQYAVRGSVVDIFTINSSMPCRIYFSGNTISTISLFDLETQNTKTNLSEIAIIPVRYDNEVSLLKNWTKNFTHGS